MIKLYKHYKGGLYLKLYEAWDVTGIKMQTVVVYQSLEDGVMYVRDKEEFEGMITFLKEPVPRFRLIRCSETMEISNCWGKKLNAEQKSDHL